jgi:hypothetical protein
MSEIAKCRVCGCTEDHACLTEEGPCYWVEDDLCSACQPVVDFHPPMHFYQCCHCVITFAVEAALEDQSGIVCPLCKREDGLEGTGYGYVTLTRLPEEEPDEDVIGEENEGA